MRRVKYFLVFAFVLLVSYSAHATTPFYAVEGKIVDVDTDEITFSDIPLCRKAGITCTSMRSVDLDMEMECFGGVANGGWGARGGSQHCVESISFCYDYGEPTQKCHTLSNAGALPPVAIEFAPDKDFPSDLYSKCLQREVNNDSNYKEYCLWNYNASERVSTAGIAERRIAGEFYRQEANVSGLTGDTNDDMMRLDNGSAAFFEYLDIGEGNKYGLKFIARNGSIDVPMMMPIGPRDTYTDYKRFLGSSADGLNVQEACYPARATVSCGPIDDRHMPGHCGTAALKNFLFKPKNKDAQDTALCKFGQPSQVRLAGVNGLAYKWTCGN